MKNSNSNQNACRHICLVLLAQNEGFRKAFLLVLFNSFSVVTSDWWAEEPISSWAEPEELLPKEPFPSLGGTHCPGSGWGAPRVQKSNWKLFPSFWAECSCSTLSACERDNYRQGVPTAAMCSGLCFVSLTDLQNQVIAKERKLHVIPPSCSTENYLCSGALTRINVFSSPRTQVWRPNQWKFHFQATFVHLYSFTHAKTTSNSAVNSAIAPMWKQLGPAPAFPCIPLCPLKHIIHCWKMWCGLVLFFTLSGPSDGHTGIFGLWSFWVCSYKYIPALRIIFLLIASAHVKTSTHFPFLLVYLLMDLPLPHNRKTFVVSLIKKKRSECKQPPVVSQTAAACTIASCDGFHCNA